MNEISVCIPGTYASAGKYLPMLSALGDHLCKCYGIGFPRNHAYSDEPLNKMVLTKIPTRTAMLVTGPVCSAFHLPQYLRYWTTIKLFDIWAANKVAGDSSKVVYTSPLLAKTVKACRKAGKIVVVEAGNSEPDREHQRIMEEYEKFQIKHQYIYGDRRFKDTCNGSLRMADKIVTISEVSQQTYIDAGYDRAKMKLIPLTGTDFPKHSTDEPMGNKQRAFISTAFHNFIKGTHRLLLAWKKANVQDVPLIIVGRICEDMQEFIERYGPFDNVIFTGHQSNLSEWYKNYDAVGILMSLSEGAGRVTPEMMSFGFPMMVSPDATCDVVKDGESGWIVDPLDVDSVAKQLKWIAEDWTRVSSMRKQVLDCVRYRSTKDFSLECAEYLLSLIDR